jgi:hypothetical protein
LKKLKINVVGSCWEVGVSKKTEKPRKPEKKITEKTKP